MTDETYPEINLSQVRKIDLFLPLSMKDSERWKQQALCAQTDPDGFYPERGKDSKLAIRVCERCPVKDACRDDADSRGEPWGIWGGETRAVAEKRWRREGRLKEMLERRYAYAAQTRGMAGPDGSNYFGDRSEGSQEQESTLGFPDEPRDDQAA